MSNRSIVGFAVAGALAGCSGAEGVIEGLGDDGAEPTAVDPTGQVQSEISVPDGFLYQARVRSSGKCANVSGNSQNDGAAVIQFTCSASSLNDRWDLVNVSGDTYQIRPAHSGKCLNVSGNSQNDGAPLIQWRCEGSNNERFHVEVVSGGVRLRAVHSNKCVEIPNGNGADGTAFVQRSCNGGANQTFQQVATTPIRVGDPIPGLSSTDVAAFLAGKEEFEGEEEADEGLGPIFNDAGCAVCHSVGAVGGGSTRLETRFGDRRRDGSFDPLANLGGSLLQDKTIGTLDVRGTSCTWALEVVPQQADVRASRRTTPLFGLGLVDLVPDSTFRSLASNQPSSVRGRTSVVTEFVTNRTDAVGKFGWKGQNPTLFQFSGDAYLFEMGITNSLAEGIAPFGVEQCPNGAAECAQLAACDPVPGIDDEDENEDGVSDGVVAFANFMKFLVPPPRGSVGSAENAGESVFGSIGCASCHTANYTTPNSGSVPQAMRSRTFHPYSDFLLHDMDSLGDQIVQGGTRAREMRTAPLWGLRFITTFLHDGRTTSVSDAIRAHRGQGQNAANAFNSLSDRDRSNLLAFLRSL